MIRETLYGYALVAVSGLLLLSLVGNYWLFKDRDVVKAGLAASQGALQTAQDAGRLCGKAVEKLVSEAEAAKKLNAPLIAAAKKKNADQQAKANTILATPATRPGDDCGSARDRGLNWLKGRAK